MNPFLFAVLRPEIVCVPNQSRLEHKSYPKINLTVR